jgi:pimeloyl-ACP methyl ester carboxylesterase
MKSNSLLTLEGDQKENSKSLIFIHGFLCSAAIWNDFLINFKNDYNTYLIHLPGHTGNGEKIETIKELAKQIALTILEHEIKEIHLIGHSLGGYISGELANISTVEIKSVTLINSYLSSDSKEKKADRDKAIRAVKITPSIFTDNVIERLFLEKNRTAQQKKIKEVQRNAKKIKAQTITSYLEAIKERDDTSQNTINIPTHYLSSIQDTTIPYPQVKNQVLRKNHHLTSLYSSNHMSFLEESELVSEAINSFFVSFKL